MDQRLSLKLLGGFRVLEPSGVVLPTRKAEALLAYLALPAGRCHDRPQLTALLWGSRDERHARHSLNQALSSLRKAFGPSLSELLSIDGGVALVGSMVRSDVARVEALLQDSSVDSLTEAAALAEGELLAGLELREEGFEVWLAEERRRLKEMVLGGLKKLLERQLIEGLCDDGRETARTLLRLDPFDEAVHRLLMELLAAAGQRNAALRQYRDCSDLLRRELDVAPEAETRVLYQRILRQEGPLRPSSPVAPLRPAAPLKAAGVARTRPPAVTLRRFTCIGTDDLDRVVAQAIGEDLLTALTRDRTLSVMAHQGVDVPHADSVYVVEGSIRRRVDRVAVAAHLLDAGSGAYLWSERWAEPMSEILEGTGRVVRRLAAVVRREVESAEARKSAELAEPLGPWSHYHLALRALYRFTMPGLTAARRHFQKSIALDPDLAAAYARLAYVYVQMYWYGSPDQREAALAAGLEAARQAVGLDPKEAHAHFALGRLFAIQRAFDQAVPEFETALTLDPSLAQASFGLGQALSAAGQPREAVSHLDQAIDLDPQDPHLWTFLHDRAEALFAQGQLSEAERNSKAAVRQPNVSHFAWATLVAILGISGKKDEARAAVRQLRLIKPDYSLEVARGELQHHANRSFVADYLQGLELAGL